MMLIRVTLLFLIFFKPLLAADDDDELEFSKDSVDYFSADLNCKKKNKELVSIETKSKNNKIMNYLQKSGDKSMFWTQGKRADDPPDLYIANSQIAYPFRWSNGHRLSFRNFAYNRPNNDVPYDKAPLFISVKYENNDVFWYDSIYGNRYKYICQKKQKSTTEAPPEPKNEYGFELTGYVVSKEFEIIMANCKEEDEQKPIKPDSEKKTNALRDICKANDNRIKYFLPMKRENGKSQYKWLDGDEVKNANWAPRQPSKYDNDKCAVFYWEPKKDTILWASSSCNITRRVACEDV